MVSQSPVWLATVYDDDLPVLVLKPSKIVASPAPGGPLEGPLEYLFNLIELGGASRDEYIINQMPRARLIEIDCGPIKWNTLKLSKEKKKTLIAKGRASVESRIKDLKYLLHSTPVPGPVGKDNADEDEAVRGGNEAMAMLRTALPSKRDQAFISYSHNDSDWLRKFQDTLKPFTWNKAMYVWDDTQIPKGANWPEEIKKALSAAKVAVLLVSIDYLASDFIRDVELQEFLRASESDGLKILPVAVGHSAYEETPLKIYQFVKNPKRPLKAMDDAEQDGELVNICKEIKKALDS